MTPATAKPASVISVTPGSGTAVPLTVDAAQGYAYVDYTYAGPSYDHAPTLANPQVTPAVGTPSDMPKPG